MSRPKPLLQNDGRCTISYHVAGCEHQPKQVTCARCSDSGVVIHATRTIVESVPCPDCRYKPTVIGALYVLQSTKTRMYYTQSKGKPNRMYWGLYIGKGKGKRYSAARFDGGPRLDGILALPGNKDIRAIRVKN
jgi:hypothetical protein